MEPEHKVYDDHDEQPVTRPDLRALEEGREETGQEHDSSRTAHSSESQESASESLYNPNDDTPATNGKDAVSPQGLDAAESSSRYPGQQFGFNANPIESLSGFRGLGAFLSKNRRKALIGGGVGAGIAGALVGGFLILVPLKIEHIVNNLQSHFFASSEYAVENETDSLFKGYVKKQLGPTLARGGCKGWVTRDCTVNVVGNGSNPVVNLYKTWSQAKLENKLADVGIELRYDKQSGAYYLKSPGIAGGEAKVGSKAAGIDGEFDQVDRGTVRATINDALKKQTGWKSVMYHFPVGRMLEEKYGIKRCDYYCGVQDTFQDKKNEKKTAAKILLTQRVIIPRTETLGIVIQCLTDPNCDPEKTQVTAPQDGSTGELHGAPENPEVDTAVRTNLVSLAASYGLTDAASVDKMIQDYKDISEKGYTQYVVDKVLEKAGLSALSDKVADATPVIGWVNFATGVISNLNNFGPKVKKLAYITNAPAVVSGYMAFRTMADEVHTGHVDPTELGSMVQSLGPGNQGAATDPEVGGTASAEASPLYSSIMGQQGNGASTFGFLGDFLPSKAYAAASTTDSSTSSNDYKCSDGKPVPSGQLVCSEEVLGQGIGSLDAIHNFLNLPGIGILTSAAGVIHSLLGVISGFIGDVVGFIISHIPGVSSLTDLVNNALKPVFTALVQQVIPNPFGSNMSGGRTFDMAAAGADVAGNDYAHNGLGGEKLTSQQVADIENAQSSEEQTQFVHQSLFARMFNTQSQYSLVSKIAMSTPLNAQSASEGLASLANPFSDLFHSFSSVFAGHAVAATTPRGDAFKVPQYGYTQADLAAIGDPQTYWDQHCSDGVDGAQTQAWDQAAASGPTDPDTGTPVNSTTDPCLLIQDSVGAAGGAFDTSNLTQDDLADVNGGSGASTGGTTPTPTAAGLTNPFPGGWTPNRLDMGYDGTFKGQIVAPFTGTVTYASNSFSNWGGYIEIKADQQPAGLPTSTLYFAEGVKPIVTSGHVAAGTPIADPAPSPYGDAYHTNPSGNGEIEWGVAADGSSVTDPLAETGISNPTQMVLNFAKWAEQSLGLPPPSQTDHAGYP